MKKFVKRLMSVALSLAVVATIFSVGAVTVKADKPEFEISVDGTLLSYNGIGGSVVIPSTVKKIDKKVFQGMKSITSVTIPKSVKTIGENAFNSCYSLSKVKMEKGVRVIEKAAFYGCTELKELTIPDSITTIDYDAFTNCNKLDGVVLPYTIDTVGNHAFGFLYSTSGYDKVVDFVIYCNGKGAVKDYCDKYEIPLITKKSLATTISDAKSKSKKSAKVSWKVNNYAQKYEIQYATNSKFTGKKTKTIKDRVAFAWNASGLKSGQTYYFRIRACRNIAGKNYYSAWSKVKSVKIK